MFLSWKLRIYRLLGVLFYIAIWQIIGFFLNLNITPFTVLLELKNLITFETGNIILYTSFLVLSGFLISFFAGVIFAYLAYRFTIFRILLDPIVTFCRSTPIVIIIMALLLYFTPENVGGIIIIATVAPIIYLNTLTSLENMNKELDEIADVFGAGTFTRAFRVHFPQIVPSLFASANIGIGFAFKSAITAQVISLTAGSIGEQVYLAKLYIDSNLLTAWLIIILITGSLLQAGISFIFSRLAYDYNLKKSS